MYQTIINAAMVALTGVIVVVIKEVGSAAVKFITCKMESVKVKIGADTYNQRLSFARQVWNIVDEEFRITPALEKTIAAKQAEFEAQIKKLIPAITDDEIEQLRQTVAGEVNKGREAITATAGGTPSDGAEVNTAA